MTNEKMPKKYKLTKEETETIILWSDADDVATIYTCNRSLQRQLVKKGYKEIYKDEYSTKFECPKTFISFRSNKERKKRTGRKLTEEHKMKLQAARKQNNALF